ncbi:MAG: aldehyde dehydrogenase [Lachnospiraceae bacterium]
MTENEINQLIQKQKSFFSTGATLPVSYRITALKRLGTAIEHHEAELSAALHADLGKSTSEGYMCEIGLVKSELSYMLKHVRRYAKEHRVRTPLAQYVSRSFVKPSPYGCVLIMSPWNYPVLLTLDPLIDAIAAGNTVVLKPSAYSPNTSRVLEQLITECFPPEYVSVVTGGRAENSCLLHADFQYIFFTGSKTVGREVMACASEHLTPVTLELGGKSPCIVDKTANLSLAARRIVFGKFLNCGQTCVAPDYIYCDASIKEQLVAELKKQIAVQFTEHPLGNPNYGKIINAKHFSRLLGLMDKKKIVCGGESDEATLRIAPTIIGNVTWDDAVMQEEIFGPLLPILTYSSLEDAVRTVNSLPNPLALYFFSSDKKSASYVMEHAQFGGGCINDTIIHLATSEMGFGGVGESGMGSYHGKKGFDTFTHEKSIVDKKTFLDLPMRYQPYSSFKDALVRMFVK